jgi:hypothetical protein
VKGTTDTTVELTANQYESATTYEGQYFILVIRYSDELLEAENLGATGNVSGNVTGVVTGARKIVANWVILKVSEGSKISPSSLHFGSSKELSSRVVTALKIKHGLDAVPTQ